MTPVKKFPDHPGEIRMIEKWHDQVRLLRAGDVPERQRFVYRDANGVETDDISKARERIPIVEVHIIPSDAAGHIVPPEKAVRIQIQEFGPKHRPVRSTTMTGPGR